MRIRIAARAAFAALAVLGAALPMAAQATVYQFNAGLNGANEIGGGSGATAVGLATLFYDDRGTASLLDDSYDFTMAVFALSGASGGRAASGFHIHGAATTTENGPVRVNLDDVAFPAFNAGSTLLVGGSGITPPTIGVTAATGSNAGHPAMSFLDMLKGGLAYVNVHTSLNPGGAVRGQLVQVAAVVPEPASMALMFSGLGVLGLLARRRRY
ncbi:CHRD domain-containing protein [Paucibacter soli]|uniref:CHRD domain-containing protein n=1 Tax=Paucibacter soli TaxID=3133433 RepID=UPI003097AFA5